MWPLKRKATVAEPQSHPPLGLPPLQFKKAQDDYVTKYEKFVKPTQLLMVEAAKVSADFGKMVINYMVLGNVGGLAALVVLAPFMHDMNKLWLAQQLGPALAFGFGAAVGVAMAVAAHFNYASHAGFFWIQSRRDDSWVKSIEFEMDEHWRRATDTWLAQAQEKASRRANLTNALSVMAFGVSAACWLYGAVSLAIGISSQSLP